MFHSLLLGRPLVSCCLHQLVGTCWHPPSTTLHLLFKQVPQAFSIYSVTVFGLMPFKEAWSIWCCAVPCCCSWAWIDNKRLPLKRKLLPNSDPVESIFRNTKRQFLISSDPEWHFIWQWHSTSHSLIYFVTFYLTFLLAFYLTHILTSPIWHPIRHISWHSIWQIYLGFSNWHPIWPSI